MHESPPSMAYVLIALGTLSVVGGLVKIPEFIATFKPFEEFLDPVFSSEVTRRITEAGIHSHATEAAFGVITFTIVVIGWLIADLMYRQQKLDPARFSQMLGGVPYEWVYNKYYVDEFYNRVIIQPYMFATRALAWFDSNIIDGVVNLAASIIVFLVVAVGTIRPLRSRWAGEFRLEPDARRGRQAATAGDWLDQWIPIRNSGRGDADIAGARGRKGMTDSAAAPLQGKREERN